MSFHVDQQTLSDLSIFAQGEATFSVYGLFKNCKTLGGRQRVEALMKAPSNDRGFLENRVVALKFFVEHGDQLYAEHSQIDLILHYLSQDKPLLRGNLIDSFWVNIKSKIRENQAYYVIKLGIRNLKELLQSLHAFVAFVKEHRGSNYLMLLVQKLEDLLLLPSLTNAFELKYKPKLSFYELTNLDALIRIDKLKIYSLLELVYEIDALQTIAKVAKEKNYCFPSYLPNDSKNHLQVVGVYHPILVKPVSNSLDIEANGNVIFMTGSNMAGKSSLLKALGITVYLAHLGFPIPASSFSTAVFDVLTSSINLPDNLESGLSHYVSEVKRIKEIVEHLVQRKKIFVLLDELFRGTNAQDATEATKMVIDGFCKMSNSVFVISSHITELADQLKTDCIKMLHLEHLMVDGKPIFTYQLKEGVSQDGIGMFFIKNEGIPSLFDQAISSLSV